ncbi:MBL fold metallo-hydrolase [Balneolales bacterium ANBcel1]|nr:MBL fold metallo-hydrolase [Balneolales bacterium ANBcel1]
MRSLSSADFGNFRLFTIETGRFRLDGGAIFGVVPKVLWSRRFESDEQNRIPLTARCLLVHSRSTQRLYLIDTGPGHKFDKKFSAIYGLDFSDYSLDQSLAFHGFNRSDVTDVVFTHMHFDHCGGAVSRDEHGRAIPHFPEARHWVHQKQWDSVQHPNAREKASFLPENIEPLAASGLLHFIDDHHIYEPGFGTEVVHGHTSGQQLPLLNDGDRKLLFAADLMPTAAHLPLPWVMGFDMRPIQTMEEKVRILGRCIRDNTSLYLEHDPNHEVIRLEGPPEKPAVGWNGTLNDL